MTVQEIKSKILEWIMTGIPNNVKSANVRTLLTWITKRMDVQETGRLRIVKSAGNTSIDLQISDRVTGIVENTFIQNAIYIGGNINLLTSYFIFGTNSGNNSSTENTYQNINGSSQLLDDQENQTQGRLQFVIDASDDPTVANGNAVYYYLGSENAVLDDYIKLSNEEVALLQEFYQTFSIKLIDETVGDNSAQGQIHVEIDQSDIVTGILFDSAYSKYLSRNKTDLDNGIPLVLQLDNTTSQKRTLFKVQSINYNDIAETSYLVKVSATENANNFEVSDIVRVHAWGSGGVGATTTSAVSTESTFEVFPSVSNQNQYNVANAAAILRARNSSVVFGLELVQKNTSEITAQIGEAQILNNSTPSNQSYKPYTLGAPQDLTITNLNATSYIYVDFTDLTIKQQVGEPTLQDQVTKLLLGRVIAIGGNIIQVANDKIYSQQLPLFIAALGRRIGKGRDSGLQLSINSASGIAMSSGIFFDLSNATETNFGFLDFESQSPADWFYTSQTSLESSKVSVFNKTQYLDNNVLVNATNGRWLSSLIYLFNSENIVISYPQSQHQSKSQAIENAYNVVLPALLNEGALIGYIVYKEGEDLTDPNFAEIFNVDRQSSNTSVSIGSGYLEVANSFNEFTEAQRLQAIVNLGIKEIPEGGTTGQVLKKQSATNFDADWENESGGGATLEQQVTQTAHGLVVGDWVRMNGGNFVKALADTATNAPAIGYVKSVTDASIFTYQYGGLVAIAGLTAGGSYFLQDNGSINTTAGTINLFVGTGTPQGLLLEIGQGFEEGGGSSLENISDDTDNSLLIGDSAKAGNVLLKAQGTGTNIDVPIVPKGTGTLKAQGNHESNISDDDDVITKGYGDANYLGGGVADLDIVQVLKTSSFTLDVADKHANYNANSSSAIVVTLPPSVASGIWWEVTGIGTGDVSFTESASVTIESPDNRKKLRTRYSSCRIVSKGSNVYQINGDIIL